MWWLGSLPCAYCPISPVMSAWSRPVVAMDAVKSLSSWASRLSVPPMQAASSSMACGAKRLYCQALASVKWKFTS